MHKFSNSARETPAPWSDQIEILIFADCSRWQLCQARVSSGFLAAPPARPPSLCSVTWGTAAAGESRVANLEITKYKNDKICTTFSRNTHGLLLGISTQLKEILRFGIYICWCNWHFNNLQSSNKSREFIVETRLAVDRVNPWLTKLINSSSSNTMTPIGNLTLDISLTPYSLWLLLL